MRPLFSDLARSRRSCRLFSDSPLDRDEVQTILDAGHLAPSSRGLKDVRLIPVTDIDTIRKLAGCRDGSARALETATFAVVVAADPGICDVWIEDSSIAAIMMQLQAEELGIGSCWIQVRLRTAGDSSSEDIVKSIMDLDESLRVLSVVAFERRPRCP